MSALTVCLPLFLIEPRSDVRVACELGLWERKKLLDLKCQIIPVL